MSSSSSYSSSFPSSSFPTRSSDGPPREQSSDDNEQRDQEESLELDNTMILENSDSSSDDSGHPDSIMLEEPPKYLLEKPLSYYTLLPGELGEYHPGTSTCESPSRFPDHTATSPECCLWFSHGINDEVREILRQVGDQDATSFDMPRIASCVRRAQRHIYNVSEDDGFAYPNLAFGELEVCRSERPEQRRPRPRLPEPGTNLASPPTSRLREVWNADDLSAAAGEPEGGVSLGLHPTLVAAIREFDSGYHSRDELPRKTADSDDNNEGDGKDASQPESRACDIDPSELAHLMALLSSIDSGSELDDEGDDENDFPGPF